MAGVATAQKANNSAAPKPQKSNPFKILGLVGFIVAAIAGVYVIRMPVVGFAEFCVVQSKRWTGEG